jgi:hypothetical protein
MAATRTIEEITARICRIPAEFHRRGGVSVVTLLVESGYQAVDQIFGVAYIREYLRIYPELIDDWATYSGDKRTSGWYFDDAILRRLATAMLRDGDPRNRFFRTARRLARNSSSMSWMQFVLRQAHKQKKEGDGFSLLYLRCRSRVQRLTSIAP